MDPVSWEGVDRDEGSVSAGTVVHGKYELVEVAGVGGMATVWRALQRGPGRFRRTVAVKHMHAHLAARSEFRTMFFEEARVGAELHDPNLAQVQDFFEEHGQLYLVMEWVEGIDLATYNRYVLATSQQTRWELITAVGIGLLRGLAAAHEHTSEEGEPAPVLHRDVSPHNVLISVKGPARLVDFGLALASDRAGAPTPPGTAKGKLAYLAPEVARGERPTPAADQFAAASVLWEALAGRKLFEGADAAEVFRKLSTADVEPLSRYRGDLPRRLSKLMSRALEADPADRFPSARAMALELGEVLKTAQSRVDLYELLARTVVDARTALNMGRRTQAPALAALAPAEESEIAIPLLFKSAWRRLRSAIPFLTAEARPRQATSPGSERTPTEVRRANAEGVLRLGPGDEARAGDLSLRLVEAGAVTSEATPTELLVHLDLTVDNRTERVALEVPGQTEHGGYLVTSLSRDETALLVRAVPVRLGQPLLVFPYVPVTIGPVTVEITAVRESKVFLLASRAGAGPEHLIVAATNKAPGVVERPGYRLTIEGLAPPWVTLRVDEPEVVEEVVEELDDDDLVEVS